MKIKPPNPLEEPKSLCTRLLKFLFGHVGLFILVSAVAALGALAFIQLEEKEEQRRFVLKRNSARDIGDSKSYFSLYMWHYHGTPNLTFEEWDKKVQKSLNSLDMYVVDAVKNYKYDGTVDDWHKDWTFSKALLFTISIMTTIGYGHIYPQTFSGQVFTIIYALVGSPLLLVFLANIGSGMSNTFTYIYSRICCRWCRTRRYQSEARRGKRVKRLMDDDVGKEEYMPTSMVQVPIVINMILISLCLVLGAVIFSKWEGWSISSACYFCFVTLSTIGFGDMVPGNSFLDSSSMAAFKMSITIIYCIFGMALISMCIQMMQEQIVTKVRWTAEELGILDSRSAERRVVRPRRSRPGAVPVTAYNADGSSRPLTGQQRRLRRQQRREARLQRETQEAERRDSEQTERREGEQRYRQESEQRERQESESEQTERQERERKQRERESAEQTADEGEEKLVGARDDDDDLFDLA